ncbi:hypothetical protein GCM10017687_24590 [Streptomyces echinatus]
MVLVIVQWCACAGSAWAPQLCHCLVGHRWLQDDDTDADAGHPRGIDTFRWSEE